jgi:hypothetical protein
VFSASPETVRRRPREFDLRRLLGQVQDLAACALRDPDAFSLRWCGFWAAAPLQLVRGGSRRREKGVDLSRGNLGTLIRDLGLAPGSEVDGIEHNTKQVRGNETQLRRS